MCKTVLHFLVNKTICASNGNQLSKSARKKEKQKSEERRLYFLKRFPVPGEDLHLNGFKTGWTQVLSPWEKKAKLKLNLNGMLYVDTGTFCTHSVLTRHKAEAIHSING